MTSHPPLVSSQRALWMWRLALSFTCIVGALALSACNDGGAPEPPKASPATTAAPAAASGTTASAEPAAAKPAAAPPSAPAKPSGVPTDADRAEAAKIAKRLQGASPDRHDLNRRTNAVPFLALAQDAKTPQERAAGLEGMDRTWTYDPRSTSKLPINDAWRALVLEDLGKADTPLVQSRAIQAAAHMVRGPKPHPEARAALLKMATGHAQPAGRLDALMSLLEARDPLDDAEIKAAVQTTLDADDTPTFVRAALLRRVAFLAPSPKAHPKLLARTQALVTDKAPAIRGLAIDLWSRMFTRDTPHPAAPPEALTRALDKVLTDAHPYTRAMAARATGNLKDPRLMVSLEGVLKDEEPAEITLDGWTQLDGTPGKLQLQTSSRDQVRLTALSALRSLTRHLPKDSGIRPFQMPPIRSAYARVDLPRAATAALDWLTAHKAKLKALDPPLEPVAPPPPDLSKVNTGDPAVTTPVPGTP